jgi:hypothetical protein
MMMPVMGAVLYGSDPFSSSKVTGIIRNRLKIDMSSGYLRSE